MTRRTGIRLLLTAGIFAAGLLFGLIMQNPWLGLLLGALAWLVWFLGFVSRRGGEAGVQDEDHGIEL